MGLKIADYISIHLPLNNNTENLISVLMNLNLLKIILFLLILQEVVS